MMASFFCRHWLDWASLEKCVLTKNSIIWRADQRKPCVTDISVIFHGYVKNLILLSQRFIKPLHFSKTAFEWALLIG